MSNPEKNKAAEELKILDNLRSILENQKTMYILLSIHLVLINSALILLIIGNSKYMYAASIIFSGAGLITAIISFRINDRFSQEEALYKKGIIKTNYAAISIIIKKIIIPDTKKRIFFLWIFTAVYLILILSGSVMTISDIKKTELPRYLIAPGM